MSNIPMQDFKHGDATTEVMPYVDGEAGLQAVDPDTVKKLGTVADQKDMRRMGKLQELRRNFNTLTIIGYDVQVGCSWPYTLVTGIIPLVNGGTASAIWMYFFVITGMAASMISMAEMASMAPTAGGQYHWVSEFASKSCQKFVSYLVGWFCVLGWQGGLCAGVYVTAVNIQGLIVVVNDSYTRPAWHSWGLAVADLFLAVLVNIFLLRRIHILEGIFFIIYIFAFVTSITVLWVMAPRGDPYVVFMQFEDNSGWGNRALATLVGLSAPLTTLIGGDSVCHLSEETKNAAAKLPWAFIGDSSLNYALGFVTVVTFMSTLGDVQTLIETPTGQPYIQSFLNATQSRVGTIALTSVIILLLIFSTINFLTPTSRQLFAFARDNGLPFSAFSARIPPGWDVPLNAL